MAWNGSLSMQRAAMAAKKNLPTMALYLHEGGRDCGRDGVALSSEKHKKHLNFRKMEKRTCPPLFFYFHQ